MSSESTLKYVEARERFYEAQKTALKAKQELDNAIANFTAAIKGMRDTFYKDLEQLKIAEETVFDLPNPTVPELIETLPPLPDHVQIDKTLERPSRIDDAQKAFWNAKLRKFVSKYELKEIAQEANIKHDTIKQIFQRNGYPSLPVYEALLAVYHKCL